MFDIHRSRMETFYGRRDVQSEDRCAEKMKFVLVLAALCCATFAFCCAGIQAANQVCSTPTSPININIHASRDRDNVKAEKGEKGEPGTKGEKGDAGTTSCRCPLQDPKKPSAHLEGPNKGDVTYQLNKVIKDWSLKAPYSHLAGGMKYNDGKLTVPISGRYYIYEQIYFRGYRGKTDRISILVNNKVVAMVQPSMQVQLKADFALSTGGVFFLKAGDVITVAPTHGTGIAFMYTFHSFFGAFLI